jgi:hypothetical protein
VPLRLPSSGVLVAALLLAGSAGAEKKGSARFHPDWAKHPSTRYGAMTADQCTAELGKRSIAFTRVQSAPGVLAPVRLPKDVGGVIYRTQIAAHLRDKNPFDVFDCRLVLALSDLSKILAAHDVDEVLMFSAWRPPSKKTWPEGKLGTRHPGGLAIDAFRFGKKLAPGQTERTWIDVEKDFSGQIGAPPCGADAQKPSPDTAGAKELRSIVCEAADQHIFTVILTPNHDRAHKNHFHLEVTPDVKWHLVK